MKNTYLSALDIYMNRIFKLLIIMIPTVALCAGTTFSVIKMLGYYPEVSSVGLTVFDCTCVLYFIIGIIFKYNCEDENGNLKERVVMFGKIFIGFVELIQWNFISYLIPSRDFWAYSIFFVMLVVLFLDHKYVLAISAVILCSTAVSWIFKAEVLLPIKDDQYISEMVLRCVLIFLSFLCLWSISFFAQKILVTELEKIAEIDTLTGLKNRRNLSANIKNAVNNYKADKKPFTLLMCDIDDFKIINDSYGHECGDRVLKLISQIILRNIAEHGTAYRIGGEEILCVIELSEKEAITIAEKIREDVEALTTQCVNNEAKITITIGATTYNGEQISEEEIIKHADSNLYYGKKHGKNRVVI